MDKTTFEQYEQSLRNTKEVQNLSEFLSFLENRCEILEKLCLLCLKSNHMVSSCKMKKLYPDCNGKYNGLLHFKFDEKKSNDKTTRNQLERKSHWS